MIIDSLFKKGYGNDCVIYKSIILIEVGGKYQVITINKVVCSWSNNELSTNIEEFDSLEEAKKYFH